ncbi:hypothetical protein [Halorientalis pallida]|uniref:Uncharacterized protein n=1 Tax=Halorientalis pallida TaxID=2479928 RepID=A0A498L4P2_9EURY|nr:hypothetical protein [Halorientalis pallida]RXK49262.1 hypothetical protein EAF64_10105 [Halorientalis pallida]
MDRRRRRAIKLVGSSGLVAIAGCSGSDTDDRGATTGTTDTDDGRDSTADADSASPQADATASTEYQEWLVSPNAFAGRDHYSFSTVDYERLRSVRTEMDPDVFGQLRSNVSSDEFAQFGIGLADSSTLINLRPMSGSGGQWNVILGSFSRGDVEEEFTDSITVSDSEGANGDRSGVSTERRGAYTLYYGGELDGTVALADGVVLSGSSAEMDSTANVESLIDAKAGETDRYTTQGEDMATITGVLGSGTFLGGSTSERVTETALESGLFEGQVGYGYADTVRGETMETREVFLFDEPASVDMESVDAYRDIELFDDFSRISASQNGRVVLVTGEVATADIYG